jgi:tyrosyl-tRNA synthetase
MIKNNGLRINNEIITDEKKIINQQNFDNDNNMKVSHGKKQHVIVKII